MVRFTQIKSEKIDFFYSHETQLCTIESDGDLTSHFLKPNDLWLTMQRYRKKLIKEKVPYKISQLELTK